ncbi:MAG: metallophosphoesterase [Oscillospiraceae bacterium]|nr:metallophosphoesterase [Oscillospiraceae bacterium]
MIYITGDTHGDETRLSQAVLKNLREGDTLIICGDFGFIWDNSKKEKKILKNLGSRKYNICFLDGAHENFELLNAYDQGNWNGGRVHHITGNLYHLTRGQVYNIQGATVFTLGGGESPDAEMRYGTETHSGGESLIHDRLPSQAELLEGANNIEKMGYSVDIIATHEPASKVKGLLKLGNLDSVRITALNSYLEELSRLCKYKKWYFGSMHMDKFVSKTQTAVFKNILEAESGNKI